MRNYFPRPCVVNTPGFDDWTRVYEMDNTTTADQKITVSTDTKFTHSQEGKIDAEVTLGVEGKGAFKLNEGYTVGDTVEFTYSIHKELTFPKRTKTWVMAAPLWEERAGTAAMYDVHGYNHEANWTGKVYFPAGADCLYTVQVYTP